MIIFQSVVNIKFQDNSFPPSERTGPSMVTLTELALSTTEEKQAELQSSL